MRTSEREAGCGASGARRDAGVWKRQVAAAAGSCRAGRETSRSSTGSSLSAKRASEAARGRPPVKSRGCPDGSWPPHVVATAGRECPDLPALSACAVRPLPHFAVGGLCGGLRQDIAAQLCLFEQN